jgi:hypothetical protein
MSIQSVWQCAFGFFSPCPVVVKPSEAALTSDAGLLPIRQFDEHIGLSQRLINALDDPRVPELIGHSFSEMLRSRLYGIVAGYEDQNDHDALRGDPVFKLIAGRRPDGNDLASQPTLSRFENSISVASLWRLRDALIDDFISSFAAPPRRLCFDLDAMDDPTHGDQQLIMFHGYYGQWQYLPLVISSADTDQIVLVSLRPGAVPAWLGADDDVEYLVNRLRAAWPDVDIELRGDAGFGTPTMYAVCERLQLTYTFGIASNAVLKRLSDDLLAEATENYEKTGQPQRLFDTFAYQAGSWQTPREIVVKAEANANGTNRRFVVTNRLGVRVLPGATYDEYADRGESENRHKELKCGLAADRLSDHRFMANFFRLYLHAAALNLLVRLRHEVAAPPAAADLRSVVSDDSKVVDKLPTEALAGRSRKQYQNRRRQHDPLGEGQPCTWRTHFIKVAAEIITSARRVVVRLAGHWPYLDYFRRVSEEILTLPGSPSTPLSDVDLSPGTT